MPVVQEAKKYLVVGAAGYLLDVGLFNLLSVSSVSPDFEMSPLIFKFVSTSCAITLTYILNSRWTFSDRRGRSEGFFRAFLYLLVNIVGLFITLVPLYISHYVLGLDSLFADNISGNFIGVLLALIFRFSLNRKFVYLAGNK